MKDFKAIFKTYSGKIKDNVGLKAELGKKFKEGGFEEDHDYYYSRMFYSKISALKNFELFLKNIKFNSVLEIGCSVGLLPLVFNEFFKDKKYTGLDLSSKSLDIAKKNFPNGKFICDDFIKSEIAEYDLIISFDVIDHVYNPNKFLKKIISLSKKYSYIRSYRGFFPNLKQHKMDYRSNEGIYLNNLSVSELEETCFKNNLSIKNFKIYKQLPREKILYDSDLGRVWNHSSELDKQKILNHTGFNSDQLNNLPTKLETSTKMIESSKNEIFPETLGFTKNYYNSTKIFSTIIEVDKSVN
tara:strand:- start:663 stop:1559 length:897 start_codon:yes stop_codon:yes gene_type:complete